MAHWWERNVVEPGKLSLLLCLVAFVVTFAVTRTITRMVRAGRGPFKDNVSSSGLHVHHAVPGLLALVSGAFIAVAAEHPSPWRAIAAILVGAGTSLVLDEFALILHLEDVYWSDEGRVSVEMVSLALACLGLVLVGLSPLGVDDMGSGEIAVRAGTIAATGVTLALIVVCVLKGKFRFALFGVFVPVLAWVGAIRLARPGSRWARRYDGARLAEAERRARAQQRRWTPLLDRVSDAVAGRPSTPEPQVGRGDDGRPSPGRDDLAPSTIATNRSRAQGASLKILVTSSRNPFALDIVRKLSEQGHVVDACDTFSAAAGSHSRYVDRHHVVASPRHQTAQFIADVEAIVRERGIEMIIPCFEEAFYLASRHAELSALTRLYTGQFAQLARLHDKVSFQHMATELGVRIPQTLVAHDDASLREAVDRFPHYFARAAFSRGGVALLTNTGPLAGAVAVEDCHPTAEQPWLVQEFVSGPMVCSYSTVHAGRITAHCTYRAPKQWQHSTGISFLAVDSGPTLEVARAFAASLQYTGQLSFDFVDSDGELFLIECNPRSTDAVLLMTSEHLAAGLTDPDAPMTVVEPGTEIQLDFAVLAELFEEPLREAPRTIHDLLRIHDSSRGWHDHMPMLWSFVTMVHGARMSHHERVAILAAMADDVVWNGEPIDGMSARDEQTLADVHAERA